MSLVTVADLVPALEACGTPAAVEAVRLLAEVEPSTRVTWGTPHPTSSFLTVYSSPTRRNNPAVLGSDRLLEDFEATTANFLTVGHIEVDDKSIGLWTADRVSILTCDVSTDH
jgi:hypothetical protein